MFYTRLAEPLLPADKTELPFEPNEHGAWIKSTESIHRIIIRHMLQQERKKTSTCA